MMQVQFPPQVKDLIESASSENIRIFSLSSYMEGPSLTKIFENINKDMAFFSIYIDKSQLEDNLWEDSHYVDKEEAHLCSIVEEEVRRYWWNRNREHLERIDASIALYKKDPAFSQMIEGQLRDRAIGELDQEVFLRAVEIVRDQYQELYGDQWETYWEKEDPLKKRVEFRYHRRYDLPPPFDYWDERNPWQQYYCAKDLNNTFCYAQGGSGGSSQRYNHGFYGHLFAMLNKQKPVPTYFFTYDSQNRFVFHREEERLWLNFFDLVGNFKIDGKKSISILDGVNEIIHIRNKHIGQESEL